MSIRLGCVAAASMAAAASIACKRVKRGGVVLRVARAHASARVPKPVKPPKLDTDARLVKVALCQLLVGTDKTANIESAKKAISDAAAEGARLVILPEMWNCPYANDSFPVYAEDIDGGDAPSASMLAEAAKKHSVVVVGGSIPERHGGNLYNTCCVFSTTGELLAKHRKVHLFDINIPGKISFQESATLTAGEQGTVVETEVGRLGLGICFDVRFPELAMVYANRGAHMLVYPGAFNTVTGPLHWQLLHQARAVDNQLFVACCSPSRNPESTYQAWGHSTLFGPFGEIIATSNHTPGIIYGTADLDQIEERRTNMPLEKQRRGDVYSLVDNTASDATLF